MRGLAILCATAAVAFSLWTMAGESRRASVPTGNSDESEPPSAASGGGETKWDGATRDSIGRRPIDTAVMRPYPSQEQIALDFAEVEEDFRRLGAVDAAERVSEASGQTARALSSAEQQVRADARGGSR